MQQFMLRHLVWFRYEFVSQGQHAVLSAAAQRGKIYLCGGTTDDRNWKDLSQAMLTTIQSFRLIDAVSMN
jgi:hypothetical protein